MLTTAAWPIMNLTLRFEDNGTAHEDIVLRWGGEEWRCDSYYLALDQGVFADRQDAEKVRQVLHRLLQQWHDAVHNLQEGEVVYLPYDFSDQYTAWLRCHRAGENVVVARGWADVSGWSFSPSRVGDYLRGVPGFRVDGPTATTGHRELLQAIKHSLAATAQSD